VDLGVTGPSALGRQAQRIAHSIVTAPHEDWSAQRGDQLDGDIAMARTLTLPARAGLDFLAHYGGLFGNQLAYVHAGLELRYGRGEALEMPSPALRMAATPPMPHGSPDGSWSVFAGANARAVLVNHLLDFQDGSTTPALDRKDVVGRFAVGGTWFWREASIAFALVQETKEFVGQRRNHGFGSVTVFFPF
jgi:lipid A 3-O-deacylase